MKKIALVVTQSSWGGAQRYVYDLAVSFKQYGHKIYVIAGKDKDSVLFNRLQEQCIETITLPCLVRNINPLVDIFCLLKLFFLFRSHSFDVVHLNSSKAGVLGSVAAWLARVPCIVYTAHGFVFNEHLSYMIKNFYIIIERISSLFRDFIITVSEFDHKTALQYHITQERKLRTIWNGIDVTNDTYVEKQKSQSYLLTDPNSNLSGKFVIGCVANLYTNKGLTFLLEAMQSVVKKHPHATLLVVGEGSLRSNLEKQIKNLKLTQHVFFVGYRKDPERYLKAFDILVSSSLKEGLSYTLLEAARARVPIIATAVGGTPEIIHNHTHGLIVPPADSKSLEGAICFAMDHPQKLKTYAIQAHERITREFSIERMSDITLAVYNECAISNHLKSHVR